MEGGRRDSRTDPVRGGGIRHRREFRRRSPRARVLCAPVLAPADSRTSGSEPHAPLHGGQHAPGPAQRAPRLHVRHGYGGRPVPAAAVAGGGGSASGFVAEVATLFIDDADRIIADIAALLSVSSLSLSISLCFCHLGRGAASDPVCLCLCCLFTDQPAVDFDKVDAHVHQLKGSSSSVGAQKVKLASMHFRQFYEAKSKEGCFMALALVRSEFYDVRSKFQTMMQLEQQIEACSPK
uniref:Histidine-containing phosphotransfer protein n=1 Tax=Hordeum vulgare subsp. vulgare TaxID=112509 RepID=A0A8I6Y0T9_HORVV